MLFPSEALVRTQYTINQTLPFLFFVLFFLSCCPRCAAALAGATFSEANFCPRCAAALAGATFSDIYFFPLLCCMPAALRNHKKTVLDVQSMSQPEHIIDFVYF